LRLLNDKAIDLAVIGEGEVTVCEIVEKMLNSDRKMPQEEVLSNIKGITFIDRGEKEGVYQKTRTMIVMDNVKGKLSEFSDADVDTTIVTVFVKIVVA
jgi:radical SAM superfamily enzyme YgiQ (UPF0313 family)